MNLISLKFNNKELAETWRCYEQNSSVSPFVYYDYVKYIYNHLRKIAFKYKFVMYCVTDDSGEILMIAPLKKDIFNGKYKMLGDLQGCGETDFIFKPSLKDSTKKECLDLLFAKIGKSAALRRISATSYLYNYLQQYSAGNISEPTTAVCVAISFEDSYDDYFKTLSSSVRQNVRTAYNRMNRDGKIFELKIYRGSELSENNRKEIMEVYIDRLFGKYKKKKGPVLWWNRFKYAYVKHDTKSLFELDNTFHAVLYIDGKIAAFMNGLANYSNTKVVVPRLAIDMEYKFYSPGYVLICETAKYMLDIAKIKTLDLVRGTEKYKTDLGGKEYYTYSFKVRSK